MFDGTFPSTVPGCATSIASDVDVSTLCISLYVLVLAIFLAYDGFFLILAQSQRAMVLYCMAEYRRYLDPSPPPAYSSQRFIVQLPSAACDTSHNSTELCLVDKGSCRDTA